jgi:flagellin
MTSVNTNMGAMTALMSLNSTASALQSTEKKISTGYKVADATDDGAAYAVAQGVRSNVSVLTAVNNQLGNANGLMQITNTAFSTSTDFMKTVSADITNLAAGTANETANNLAKFTQDVKQLQSFLTGATYNGQSLIKTSATDPVTASAQAITLDESGTQATLSVKDASSVFTNLASVTDAASASAFIKPPAGGGDSTLTSTVKALTTLAAQAGSDTTFISNQQTYNSSKMDALNVGLGALVDADLAKESANLTALQIKQQLGQQSLSISNQAPSGLVSLFR